MAGYHVVVVVVKEDMACEKQSVAYEFDFGRYEKVEEALAAIQEAALKWRRID